MNEFGAQCMVSPLRRVILRPPAPGMAAADPRRWHYGNALDQQRLEAQHAAFAGLLAAQGVECLTLDDGEPGLHDAVFTHDPSLVCTAGAVLLRMGKALRAAEVDAHARLYQRLGVPLLGRIEAPGTIEGGDCLWLDAATLAVGRGFRSNQSGIEQLHALLAPRGIEVLAFDLPVNAGEDACLHLMSLISLLDRDLALVYRPLLPVAFHQLLAARGIETIDAPAGEFEASSGLSLNVLATAPRHCIAVAGFERTLETMTAAGCVVDTFVADDLCIQCEGGPTCLSRPLWREPGGAPAS